LDACFPYDKEQAILAIWLNESKHTVILTVAGMSTESGIPDFRSKDGWWNKIDPVTVSSIDALENNYSVFREFYSSRLNTLQGCNPHEGHNILAAWEKQDIIKCIATQNIDGLHQAAGNRNVYELHGSIHHIKCHKCGAYSTKSDFLSGKSCEKCGGVLRPDIILFGELLPENVWQKVICEIEKSDLLIIIGSSLKVSPVNKLPLFCPGRTVIINNEATDLDSKMDLVIKSSAGAALKKLNEILKDYLMQHL
jgi:NAD-dependent deacetylase